MPDQLVCVVVVVSTAMVVSGLEEVWQLGGGALGGVLLHPGDPVIAAAPGPAPGHHQAISVGYRDAAGLAENINTS